ncbi:MAG: chorismate-binding protein, partial [Desulfobulbaceae bacterium]|nr:chorismate-binding protein [Desulfobulbaceae bacterium]
MKRITRDHMASLLHYLATKEEFILLDTSKPTTTDHTTFLFIDPLKWISCPPDGDPSVFLKEAQQLHDRGYYLSGWFGYEFGYLLEPNLKSLSPVLSGQVALLGVFDRVHTFNHLTGQFSQDFPCRQTIGDITSSYQIDNLKPNISREEYLGAIERVKQYVVAGDTYQVNYTFKLDFSFSGSPAALYLDLRKNQSVSYGAWIRSGATDIMSFSPELFFRSQHGIVTVKPMKGTMRRGRTGQEDARLQIALANDAKNKSENVMIVDLLRNDLGRLIHDSGGGEVKPISLFDVE